MREDNKEVRAFPSWLDCFFWKDGFTFTFFVVEFWPDCIEHRGDHTNTPTKSNIHYPPSQTPASSNYHQLKSPPSQPSTNSTSPSPNHNSQLLTPKLPCHPSHNPLLARPLPIPSPTTPPSTAAGPPAPTTTPRAARGTPCSSPSSSLSAPSPRSPSCSSSSATPSGALSCAARAWSTGFCPRGRVRRPIRMVRGREWARRRRRRHLGGGTWMGWCTVGARGLWAEGKGRWIWTSRRRLIRAWTRRWDGEEMRVRYSRWMYGWGTVCASRKHRLMTG